MPKFEIDGNKYDLTEDVKEYFLSRLESENTIDAYFDGSGVLVHEYRKKNGEVVCAETDVIEIFETYPDEARQVLEEAGLFNTNGTFIPSSSLKSLEKFR